MTEADEPDSQHPAVSSDPDLPERAPDTAEESSDVSHPEPPISAEEPAPEAEFQDGPELTDADASASQAEDAAPQARHRGKKPKRKSPWWELPALVVGAIVLAILLKSF